jgi:hypothetical protein
MRHILSQLDVPIGQINEMFPTVVMVQAGRYDDAIVAAQKACALATAAGEPELLEKNRKLLDLYRAHQPYHEAVGKFVPAAP